MLAAGRRSDDRYFRALAGVLCGLCGQPNETSFVFENYPTNRDQVACFQAMIRLLIALGPEEKSVSSLQLVAKDLPRARDFSPADVAELDRQQMVLASAHGGFAVCTSV